MNGHKKATASFLATLLLALAACVGLPGPAIGPTLVFPTPPTPEAQEERVDGYVAVAPRVLRAGQGESVSVSLLRGDVPASATVKLALLKDGKELATTGGHVKGQGQLALAVPPVPEGDYQLQISGKDFSSQSPVRVEEGTLVFVETDKPIYKPGQAIHFRVMTLDPQLKPVSGAVSLEVMDAKGLKVFKKDVSTDDFGMAGVDLPLSTEPNLGVWKAMAKAGKREAQLDVRVERYVLPKYEVKVELPRDWILASDQITGSIAAEYSYGKPVQGEVEVRAMRYVGSWQEVAKETKEINGTASFQLPPVRYVSGVPGSGGMGNVQLEVVVREKSTGYEEKTTELLKVASTPVVLKVIPESVTFKPGLPLSLLVMAETPDRKPLDAELQLAVNYTKKDFNTTQETRTVQVAGGRAMVQVTPPADTISLTVAANNGRNASTSLALQASHSPSGSFIHLEPANQGALKVGDTARFKVRTTKQATNFYYEVLSRGKVVFTSFSSSPD
ncbi:MAG TPA: MG2 domain-containing protein, partial [Chloroflexota bacterium]|nr:MG2 domain-containing protein [Chloroflexota bacterium]